MMATTNTQTITCNGDNYHYRMEGAGRVLLLVHGFAEDSQVWDRQVDYLKAHFRVITVDLPGSHLPEKTDAAPRALTMDDFAAGLLAILDKEQIAQAILIGHSMGGYITLAFAEKYPDRLQAFGLFHSTAYPDSEEKKAVRRRGIEFIRNNGAAKFLEQSIPNLFSDPYKKAHPEAIQSIVDRYAEGFQPAALIRYYEAMILRPDRTAVLRSFPRPILFVVGRHDGAVPPDQLLPQTHLPAVSSVEVLENSGHMGMMEETDAANALLYRFCGELVTNY